MNPAYQGHNFPQGYAQTAQPQGQGFPPGMDLAALQHQGLLQQQQQLAFQQQQRMIQAQQQAQAQAQAQQAQAQAMAAANAGGMQAMQGMQGMPNMQALAGMPGMQGMQGMQGLQVMQEQARMQAQMHAMQAMQGAMGQAGMPGMGSMGGMGTPGSSSSKKKKIARTPAQQLLGRQSAHLSTPHGGEHYRQNAMLPPGHAQSEPWADALDELDPREMAMGRFRARQEVLSEVFGPDEIKNIPTEGPDPWAGLGMDAETIEQRIAQLEAENAELERRLEGPEEGLWKGVDEEAAPSEPSAGLAPQPTPVIAPS